MADLPPNLTALTAEFAASGLGELHLRCPGFELFLSRDASAGRLQGNGPAFADGRAVSEPAARRVNEPVPGVSPPAAPAAPAAIPADAIIVSAPNLGTFYRAPKPGAANYVEVGSIVKPGDELCLIEVMKLFTALTADAAGTIHAILVADGEMVEGGQPLFALVRD